MLANVVVNTEPPFFVETTTTCDGNPWLSDHTLLNLAMWWVKMTSPESPDFAAEVALTFDSLERDLRPVSRL